MLEQPSIGSVPEVAVTLGPKSRAATAAGLGVSDAGWPDLDSRAQIHDRVITFYRDVMSDVLLRPVFDEVAEVDWATHIPKLIDFWCRVLLGHPGYEGHILGAHQEVHAREAFEGELFDRWYLMFVASVDEGWRGPLAEKAKAHAARIAAILAGRLIGLQWEAPQAYDLDLEPVTGGTRR